MSDKRKFEASFSVRMGTQRVRFELSPATIHGGSAGAYRVRIDRRWYDSPEGDALFLTREHIARLLVDTSLDTLEPLPPVPPDFRNYTRCGVTFMDKGEEVSARCIVLSPPIRSFDGQYYVFVQAAGYGRFFAPTNNITVRAL